MARSPGFGSAIVYFRPIKTRFRCGSALSSLTSQPIVTRRFILQKARHHPLTGSDFLQAYGFRFCFTPLPRFFSPFLHSTGSLSLTRLYSALADGPACFRQDFPCLAVLRIPLDLIQTSPTGLSPSPVRIPIRLGCPHSCLSRGPTTPSLRTVWANPLSLAATQGITCCFLFLRVLRCFSSPGTSLTDYVFIRG